MSWVLRRCVKCQRFLGKKQIKYCDRCAKSVLNLQKSLWEKTHRDSCNKNQRDWYNKHEKVDKNCQRNLTQTVKLQ